MPTRFRFLPMLACGLLVSASAHATMASLRLGLAENKAAGQNGDKPAAYVLETATPPKLDGTLDDEIWAKALPLALTQTLDGGGRASQATEVRLLRDAQFLYVGVKCAEAQMDKLQGAPRGRDGAIWSDDSIEFFLSVPDSGTYYHFGVNSFGSTCDGQEKDSVWDSDFKAAAAKGKSEWSVTCAIPLEKLQSKGKPLPGLNGNFHRNRYAGGKLEEWAWSPTFEGSSHVPDRFGKLLFATPPKEETGVKETGAGKMELLACEGGEGVVRFDLSALPRNAKVYRADLLLTRSGSFDGADDGILRDIEILPLLEAFTAGAPQGAGQALALRAPWFDRFDATEALRAWAAGKPNGGFFFKVCTDWNKESTALEICYEGQPENPPAPASGVKAFHNAGQTFITWKEIEDPVGKDTVQWKELKPLLEKTGRRQLRYAVYRHTKAITAENLHDAQLLALVKPASCWNANGRNIEQPIDRIIATQYALFHGHWNPFSEARMDADFGKECEIGRLVIKDGEAPLPSGTGLYVHTADAEGKAYYAVVTTLNGVQNTADISGRNATGACEETKGAGQPVLQKEFPRQPYFNYREKRLHYVKWEAPPYVNLPSEYYNWSVAVPEATPSLQAGSPAAKPVPPDFSLELNLHPDDRSYQRTQYRIEPASIVVTPHDFPCVTWWYGYHEALGTLKSFKQGVVQPYTERRILWFIDWVAKRWPVDRNRIFVTGRARAGGGPGPGSYGCATGGALHLGLRHPEVFCAVMTGYANPDYSAGPHPTQLKIWGKPGWEVKTDTGQNVWDELNLNKYVASLPAATDLPLITDSGGRAPREILDFLAVLLEKGHSVIASYGDFGGPKLIPVSLACTWPPPVIRAEVRKNQVLPAFGRSKAESIRNLPKPFPVLNTGYRWKSNDIVDQAKRLEITVWREGREDAATDVTLRRCQNFKLEPGKTCVWVNQTPEGAEVEKGEVTIEKDGLLTLRNVRISEKGSRLVVTVK